MLRGSIYPSMQVGQPQIIGQPPIVTGVTGGQVGYMQFASNAVNQIPVHQSIMMHKWLSYTLISIYQGTFSLFRDDINRIAQFLC